MTGLLVDFGGVLSTSQFESLLSFCRREGLPANAFDAVVSSPEVVELECGRMGQPDFARWLARIVGVDPENLFERIGIDLRPEQDVLDAVAKVRAQGYPVGVLSNSWGSSPYDAYAPWHLDEHFDTVVISDQVGLRKPDPAIYRLAAERLGVPPADCVFVDDHAGFLEPASRLGMTTVHATDPATTVEALGRLFPVIRSSDVA